MSENSGDWYEVELGEVSEISAGGNAPQGDAYFVNGSHSFVRVKHFDGASDYISDWDQINEKAIEEYKLHLFPENAIVFPKSGASIRLEKRAMLPKAAYVVSHLCVVIPCSAKIHYLFLFYLLSTQLD